MPTSLIFVVLVVAWLVVLVPIVARRREKVPEMDESGARFRVLHRASSSLRKRRIVRPAAENQTSDEDDELIDEQVGELDEELLDDDADEFAEADDGDSEDELDDELDEDELDSRESDAQAWEPAPDRPVLAHAGSRPFVGQREASAPGRVTLAERPRRAPDEQPPHARAIPPEPVEDFDDERYRPIPQRRGRGGYDPEAAEATRAYRFKRRRRVTAILLLATIVFALAGYLVRPVLWSGAVLFGLLMVGYLAYLRRQVRIEGDIRNRRLAKMHRARQIRPEFHVAPGRRAAPADRTVASPPAASLPSDVYTGGRHVVDLDDDDPGFEDLEYYEPYRYRRAAGQ